MRYIIVRSGGRRGTKTEFWEFPENLNDKLLLSAIQKIYDVDGMATIDWFDKPSKRSLKHLAYAFDPYDLVQDAYTTWGGVQREVEHSGVINVIFKTKNGYSFKPKKFDFTVSEWNELFKLWEHYKTTKKKTPKEKEHSLKCLDLVETMNQDTFLDQIAVHDILT